VVAEDRGRHLASEVLLREVLDRSEVFLLLEHRVAEAAVPRGRVVAPLDRRDRVLPLAGELGTLVVVHTDASDVGVDDVVVDTDVRHSDDAGVCELSHVELVAGEHGADRRCQLHVAAKDALMCGQRVLLNGRNGTHSSVPFG
jgi:hypothetical protein